MPINKVIQDSLTTEKKGEKKYLILNKNPWLKPKDNFGKLERDWVINKVTTILEMFSGAKSFNQIGGWIPRIGSLDNLR